MGSNSSLPLETISTKGIRRRSSSAKRIWWSQRMEPAKLPRAQLVDVTNDQYKVYTLYIQGTRDLTKSKFVDFTARLSNIGFVTSMPGIATLNRTDMQMPVLLSVLLSRPLKLDFILPILHFFRYPSLQPLIPRNNVYPAFLFPT